MGFLAVGLLLSFFGRVLFYILLFIVGGTIVGLLGYGYGLFSTQGDLTSSIAYGVGGFILGGILAIFLLNLFLLVLGGIIGAFLAFAYFPDNIIALAVLAILFAIVVLVVFHAALVILTAIMGGFLIQGGLLAMDLPIGLALLAAIIIALIGMIFQFVGPLRDRESVVPLSA